MSEKPQYRLKRADIVTFFSVGGFVDLLTFIPGVGDVVIEIFWPIAIIYLWKKGLGLINGKRIAVEVISFVAELIPGVQEFPTILAACVAIVIMSRAEDRLGIKLTAKGSISKPHLNTNGVRAPQPKASGHIVQAPLNTDGMRQPSVSVRE